MHYRYIILTIICTNLLSTYAISQTDTSVLRSPGADECFSTIVINNEYKIHLMSENGIDVLLDDGGKIAICESSLPISIKLENLAGNNVVSNYWDYSKCECEPSSPTNNLSTFLNSDKMDKKIKIIFNDEDDDEVELEFKINKLEKLKVDVKKSIASSAYGFDYNSHKPYPDRINNLSWKVITEGSKDNFTVSSKGELAEKYFNYIPLDDNLSLTNVGNKEIEISHLNTLTQGQVYSYMAKFCDDYDLINIDVLPPKTVQVDMYTLQESDDDIPRYCVNFIPNNIFFEPGDVRGDLMFDCMTPISSLPHEEAVNYVCIDKGNDGSLDGFGGLSKYTNRDNGFSDRDELLNAGDGGNKIHKLEILAGEDKICNERPVRFEDNNGINSLDPTYQDIQQLSGDVIANELMRLQSIYAQVNVDIQLNYHGLLPFNYDFKEEDNQISSNNEQRYLHALYHHDINIANLSEPINTAVWEVNKIVVDNENIAGLATSDPDNNVSQFKNSLTVSRAKSEDRTIAHEIGHARYNLGHPDGSINCQGGGSGDNSHTQDGMTSKYNGDIFNFMNSGCMYGAESDNDELNISDLIVRRYQWIKIHKL